MSLAILQADLSREDHQRDVLTMTDIYARDAMGNDGPLPAEVMQNLISGLRQHPTTMVFLAYIDEKVVGIATCFVGFSTFAARPLINVHDLAVRPECRGQGIGVALLAAVEAEARQRGYAKLTLEVLEDNGRAHRMYESFGFKSLDYGQSTGRSLFLSKKL
jgi:ribosomal protein S18 acetylase RimI-like enzyme